MTPGTEVSSQIIAVTEPGGVLGCHPHAATGASIVLLLHQDFSPKKNQSSNSKRLNSYVRRGRMDGEDDLRPRRRPLLRPTQQGRVVRIVRTHRPTLGHGQQGLGGVLFGHQPVQLRSPTTPHFVTPISNI